MYTCHLADTLLINCSIYSSAGSIYSNSMDYGVTANEGTTVLNNPTNVGEMKTGCDLEKSIPTNKETTSSEGNKENIPGETFVSLLL